MAAMPRLIASIAEGERADTGIGLFNDSGGEKSLGDGLVEAEQPASISKSAV